MLQIHAGVIRDYSWHKPLNNLTCRTDLKQVHQNVAIFTTSHVRQNGTHLFFAAMQRGTRT